MRRRTWPALAGLAAALLAPAAARADIFAAVQVAAPAPRTDFDVAVLNASTGARVALPAGTNTAADETHPIDHDRRQAAGLRALGPRRRHRAHHRRRPHRRRRARTSSTASRSRSARPASPAISPDGSKVVVGGPLTKVDNTSNFADLISTDLAPFPTGPYVHTTLRPQYTVHLVGTVDDPVVAGQRPDGVRHQRREPGAGVMRPDGTASIPQGNLPTSNANPAIAADHPTLVAFDSARLQTDLQSFSNGDIVFRPADVPTFVGPPTALPAIVNSSEDESQPALTSDERYLAFVRHGADGHDRLLVWDSANADPAERARRRPRSRHDARRGQRQPLTPRRSSLTTSSMDPGGLITVRAERLPRASGSSSSGSSARIASWASGATSSAQRKPRAARHLQEGPPRHPLGP